MVGSHVGLWSKYYTNVFDIVRTALMTNSDTQNVLPLLTKPCYANIRLGSKVGEDCTQLMWSLSLELKRKHTLQDIKQHLNCVIQAVFQVHSPEPKVVVDN